jgi:Reverse transcriptase (RNA-dependent DNA polymerase)
MRVRQGDHLSPYLFILVADGLNKMIHKSIRAGHLKGLGPSDNSHEKIVNLQYADDTLIFLKANAKMVENLKRLFISFEGFSDLKVNFAKSELIPLNISSSQAFHFSQILRCKLGKLSIKYLGISLHWKAPSKEVWMDLVHKVQSRLQVWKGKFLSLGEQVVLLNSVLSSIPLYYLSLYKVPSWCLLKIDRIRRYFLWAGVDKGNKRYMALMHWSIVCIPKQFGGLGLLNLKYMNRVLLLKWWWGIFYGFYLFMEVNFNSQISF